MHLGALMGHMAIEDDAVHALEALSNLVLFAEVEAMGSRYGESAGEYVANATRRFAAQGSDEDWLNLMTVMERSDDPAHAALERMIRWAINRDAADGVDAHAKSCSCGGIHSEYEKVST